MINVIVYCVIMFLCGLVLGITIGSMSSDKVEPLKRQGRNRDNEQTDWRYVPWDS